MKIARALFVASYKIGHACLSLQFDRHIKNIDETYVFTNWHPNRLDAAFRACNIDTSTFVYVEDREMNTRFPTIKNWWFDDDPRGSWLYQQALKLGSLDYINADVILIQDPDAFCIEPYHLVTDNKPNLFILPYQKHSFGYYDVIKNTLGFERQTKHCFVSEFMPVFKDDWAKLKHTLETKYGGDCFDAIINNVTLKGGIRWFSEYEYLGNWTMTQRPVNMIEQKRFEYKTIDELDMLTNEYNCVCDAIPKLSDSILFDVYDGTVTNFDLFFDKVKKFI